MNRKTLLAVLSSVAFVTTLGCNPAALSYFLFKGDGKAPAEYPIAPPEGKKEITIALLIAAPNAPLEFAGIERDLARQLSQILTDQSKGKKHEIHVVDQSRIDRFKLTTPGWKTMPQGELAKALRADYVIDAKVTNLSLYESGYTGRHMYQGQGTVDAEVYEAATGRQHCHYFINAKLETKPADSVPASQYRTLLVQRIADEMSWKHLPHVTDRRVAPVQ